MKKYLSSLCIALSTLLLTFPFSACEKTFSKNGDSAYQIWLNAGNTGTEEDFLNSLKGTNGTNGINGTNGDSAYQIWLNAGNTGTEEDFLNSLKGTNGTNGINGRGIAHTEIINGSLWVTYTDDMEHPVNVGKLTEELDGSEDLAYILSEDKSYYIVRGIGLCSDYDVIIPTTHKGLPVKEIAANAFKDNEQIQSLTIQDNVETIGASAFYNCDNLTSVDLGESIVTIKTKAFYSCDSLPQIIIPDSVLYTEEYLFGECENLYVYIEAESVPLTWNKDWNYIKTSYSSTERYIYYYVIYHLGDTIDTQTYIQILSGGGLSSW